MKKLLSAVLSVLMAVMLIPSVAMADSPAGISEQGQVILQITDDQGTARFSSNNGRLGNGLFNTPISVYLNSVKIETYSTSIEKTEEDTGYATLRDNGDGTFTFIPTKAGTVKVQISFTHDEKEYKDTFTFDVESGDVGQNGNQNDDANKTIRIFSGNSNDLNELKGRNLAFDEFASGVNSDKGIFYLIATIQSDQLDGNTAVTPKLVDHYKSMDNVNGTWQEVTVSNEVVSFTEIKDGAVYDALREQVDTQSQDFQYFFYAVEVDSTKIYGSTRQKCGIIRGELSFIGTTGDTVAEGELTICGKNFVTEPLLSNAKPGNLCFSETTSGNSIKEKVLKMYESPSSEDNTVYLFYTGDKEPKITAYSTYTSVGNSKVYKQIDDSKIVSSDISKEVLGDNNETHCLKINMSTFLGHNDILLVATTSDDNRQLQQTSVVLTKEIQYKYNTGTLAIAQDPTDYMNTLAKRVDSDFKYTERLSVNKDGETTTMTDRSVGSKKSSNVPYSGGYFGTVIKPANGYELTGIVSKTYGVEGKEGTQEVYLDYSTQQKTYILISKDGSFPTGVEEDIYKKYPSLQVSYLNDEKGICIMELNANVAQYSYDKDNKKYWINTQSADEIAEEVDEAYSQLREWISTMEDAENIQVSLLDTCLYYDIDVSGIYTDVETYYQDLDKVGTVELVTKEVSKDDVTFGTDKTVGIKASDDASKAAWGEGNPFKYFSGNKMPTEDRRDYEKAINGFFNDETRTIVGGYDFTMGNGSDFNGLVDVYMPVPEGVIKPEECQIYWMDDNGNPIPMMTRYVNGYWVFTASHFSNYVVAAKSNAIGENYEEEIVEKPVTIVPSYASSGAAATGSLTTAKTEATNQVEGYVEKSDYEEAEQAEIQKLIDEAKEAIAAAKTEEEIAAIEAELKEKIDAVDTAEEKATIAMVEKTKVKATSKQTTVNGKKAVSLSWTVPEDVDFDGYAIYRSTKRSSGYGKKPIFTTTKTTYSNTKGLKKGVTYYYKVRGYKVVNGRRVYSQYSYKSWRTVK